MWLYRAHNAGADSYLIDITQINLLCYLHENLLHIKMIQEH